MAIGAGEIVMTLCQIVTNPPAGMPRMPDISPVTESDRPTLEAFMDARLPWAMFPRANLADEGLDGAGEHACRFWLLRHGDAVTGALALTRAGGVLPVIEPADAPVAARALRGATLTALIGPALPVRALLAAMPDVAAAPCLMRDEEDHFILPLAELKIPDGPGHLVPFAAAPDAVLRDWLAAYEGETLSTPPDAIPGRVETRLRAALAGDTHRVLMHDCVPLAMTGFNARLPGIVQVGGVYTPPALRGRQHARRAVALHLAEARDQGVGQATLFAANAAASRAYAAIGFRKIGLWSVILLTPPGVIHG